MDQDFTLYHALTDQNQIKSVLLRHATSGGEVLVRTPKRSIAAVVTTGLSDHDELMIASREEQFGKGLASAEQVSVWFDSYDGGYFFECRPRTEAGYVYLSVGECLYQQQRRSEFRYVIPSEYRVMFALHIDGLPRCPVKDVNQSGLGFEISPEFHFSIGDKVDGDLYIGSHSPVQLAGVIRRAMVKEESVYLGVEFNHSVYQSEADLGEKLLYLRHDVYYLKRTS